MRTIIRKFTAGVLVTCGLICTLCLPKLYTAPLVVYGQPYHLATAITGVPSTLLYVVTAAICGVAIGLGIALARGEWK